MGFFHTAGTSFYLLKFSSIVQGEENLLAVANLVVLALDGGTKPQAPELPSILSQLNHE